MENVVILFIVQMITFVTTVLYLCCLGYAQTGNTFDSVHMSKFNNVKWNQFHKGEPNWMEKIYPYSTISPISNVNDYRNGGIRNYAYLQNQNLVVLFGGVWRNYVLPDFGERRMEIIFDPDVRPDWLNCTKKPDYAQCTEFKSLMNLNSILGFDLENKIWEVLNEGSSDPETCSWPESSTMGTFSSSYFPCGRVAVISAHHSDTDDAKIALFGGARAHLRVADQQNLVDARRTVDILHLFADLWVHDVTLNEWAMVAGSPTINAMAENEPIARVGASTFWIEDSFYIFGGTAVNYYNETMCPRCTTWMATFYFRDIWKFDFSTAKFSLIGGDMDPISNFMFWTSELDGSVEYESMRVGPEGNFSFFTSTGAYFMSDLNKIFFVDVHPALVRTLKDGFEWYYETGPDDHVSLAFFDVETEVFHGDWVTVNKLNRSTEVREGENSIGRDIDSVSRCSWNTVNRWRWEDHEGELWGSRVYAHWSDDLNSLPFYYLLHGCLGNSVFLWEGHSPFSRASQRAKRTLYFGNGAVEVSAEGYYYLTFSDTTMEVDGELELVKEEASNGLERKRFWITTVGDKVLSFSPNGEVFELEYVFSSSVPTYVVIVIAVLWVSLCYIGYCLGLCGCCLEMVFMCENFGAEDDEEKNAGAKWKFIKNVVLALIELGSSVTKIILLIVFLADGAVTSILTTLALKQCLDIAIYFIDSLPDMTKVAKWFMALFEFKEMPTDFGKCFCDFCSEKLIERRDWIEEIFHVNQVVECFNDPICFVLLAWSGLNPQIWLVVVIDIILTTVTFDNILFGRFPELSKYILARIFCCKNYRKNEFLKVPPYSALLGIFLLVIGGAYMATAGVFEYTLWDQSINFPDAARISQDEFYSSNAPPLLFMLMAPVMITLSFSTTVSFGFEGEIFATLPLSIFFGVLSLLAVFMDMGKVYGGVFALVTAFSSLFGTTCMCALCICACCSTAVQFRAALKEKTGCRIMSTKVRPVEKEMKDLFLEKDDD